MGHMKGNLSPTFRSMNSSMNTTIYTWAYKGISTQTTNIMGGYQVSPSAIHTLPLCILM